CAREAKPIHPGEILREDFLRLGKLFENDRIIGAIELHLEGLRDAGLPIPVGATSATYVEVAAEREHVRQLHRRRLDRC
ncbi:MAG: hypothetical protein ABMA00_04175, partial [Gemmatimonas sp.]